MSVFYNEDVLVDATLKGYLRKLFEKWNKLTKFAYFSELLLEEFPNGV